MKLKVELEIDLGDNFINENDIEEREWLFETLLTKEELILHSNDTGDSIGTITSIKAFEKNNNLGRLIDYKEEIITAYNEGKYTEYLNGERYFNSLDIE